MIKRERESRSATDAWLKELVEVQEQLGNTADPGFLNRVELRLENTLIKNAALQSKYVRKVMLANFLVGAALCLVSIVLAASAIRIGHKAGSPWPYVLLGAGLGSILMALIRALDMRKLMVYEKTISKRSDKSLKIVATVILASVIAIVGVSILPGENKPRELLLLGLFGGIVVKSLSDRAVKLSTSVWSVIAEGAIIVVGVLMVVELHLLFSALMK